MKDLLLCVHVVVKTLNLEIHVLVWQTTSKKSSKVGPGTEEKYCYKTQNQDTKCMFVVDECVQ